MRKLQENKKFIVKNWKERKEGRKIINFCTQKGNKERKVKIEEKHVGLAMKVKGSMNKSNNGN